MAMGSPGCSPEPHASHYYRSLDDSVASGFAETLNLNPKPESQIPKRTLNPLNVGASIVIRVIPWGSLLKLIYPETLLKIGKFSILLFIRYIFLFFLWLFS